jgi:hypothetical protein
MVVVKSSVKLREVRQQRKAEAESDTRQRRAERNHTAACQQCDA